MARILKRPMFNRGGSTNNGIMTGLVDRKGYANGPTQSEIYAKEYEDMLSKIDPPRAKLPLGQVGLNLISGQYAGDGLLQNIAGSAKDPYASFVKQDDALQNLGYQKRMTAAKMGISRAEAERLAKIKAAGTSSMQKDYTPQRAYETQVAANIESAGKLKSFQKPDINQKYPRATAEYDTYILRNLRSTTNEVGQLIAANNMGFVPFDPKTQTFDYGSMRPGAFYYDPRIRSFVQRMPASDDDEGGIFIYDKNTFKKRKFEQ